MLLQFIIVSDGFDGEEVPSKECLHVPSVNDLVVYKGIPFKVAKRVFIIHTDIPRVDLHLKFVLG